MYRSLHNWNYYIYFDIYAGSFAQHCVGFFCIEVDRRLETVLHKINILLEKGFVFMLSKDHF